MRAPVLFLALLAFALVVAGCGGPADADKRLAEACERQLEETAEEEGGTPTAKSTDERLERETLVECAGQDVTVVAAEDAERLRKGADAEGEDSEGADEGEQVGGEDAAESEDPGSGGDEAMPVELDPEARDTFAGTCGGCHTLSDAGTSGAVGPNLDETDLDTTGVREIIENGRGAMPAGLLQGEEADAVAEYVAAAASQS